MVFLEWIRVSRKAEQKFRKLKKERFSWAVWMIFNDENVISALLLCCRFVVILKKNFINHMVCSHILHAEFYRNHEYFFAISVVKFQLSRNEWFFERNPSLTATVDFDKSDVSTVKKTVGAAEFSKTCWMNTHFNHITMVTLLKSFSIICLIFF